MFEITSLILAPGCHGATLLAKLINAQNLRWTHSTGQVSRGSK
jgi:hypothetical protein